MRWESAAKAQFKFKALRLETLVELERYSDAGQSFVLELFQIYLDTAPGQYSELRKQFDSRDYKTVRLIAHTLKATSASLGALPLASICETIEEQTAPGSTAPGPETNQAILNLEIHFDAVVAEIRQLQSFIKKAA